MRRNASIIARSVGLALVIPGFVPIPASGHSPTPAGGSVAPGGVTHAFDATLEPVRGRPSEEPWAPRRSAFTVRARGEPVAWETMALVVLPGEEVELAVPDGGPSSYRLVYGAGEARDDGPGRWAWTAPPDPGIAGLRIEAADGSAAVNLNVLVEHPRSQMEGESLLGYRIGRYRDVPLRGDPVYLPPEGFVEVRPEDEDVLVTPHFTLGQFLCKQPGERRFVSLTVPLLRKLETVLEATNEAGYSASTLHVMSGFRTPAYNRVIGNTTDYSRHLWGDAADVFLDADGNGDMDDLNGDGRSDLKDARVLYDIADRIDAERLPGVPPGGLGLYRRNAVHGPFVHVDARGYRARW